MIDKEEKRLDHLLSCLLMFDPFEEMVQPPLIQCGTDRCSVQAMTRETGGETCVVLAHVGDATKQAPGIAPRQNPISQPTTLDQMLDTPLHRLNRPIGLSSIQSKQEGRWQGWPACQDNL